MGTYCTTNVVCSQIDQLRWAGACYVVELAIGCEFGFPSHVVWQLSLYFVGSFTSAVCLSTGYALCLSSVTVELELLFLLTVSALRNDPSPFRQVALGSMNDALLLLVLIACSYLSLLPVFACVVAAVLAAPCCARVFRFVTNSISVPSHLRTCAC
jgi:hypothetical protein